MRVIVIHFGLLRSTAKEREMLVQLRNAAVRLADPDGQEYAMECEARGPRTWDDALPVAAEGRTS